MRKVNITDISKHKKTKGNEKMKKYENTKIDEKMIKHEIPCRN